MCVEMETSNLVHTTSDSLNVNQDSSFVSIANFVSVPPANLTFSIKLDSSNFLIWHEQLLSLIVAYRLESYVDGSQFQPSKFLDFGGVNPEFLMWIRINGTIKSWIYGFVMSEVSLTLVSK